MSNLSDELIHQGDKWFKRIPHEEAFRIRCDVPLFWRTSKGYVDYDVCCIDNYRNGSHTYIGHVWWSEYPWYIEVDSPDKEEYEPEQRRCDHDE